MAVGPSPDAVSEFQVIGEAFAAEYSRTGGAAFNVVLKSGTNQLHGDVYEYVRNDATNARNPFTSIDSQGKIIKSRQLRFNNFGGTLGGPVVIPHVYNGKDRTFFFFSWDTSILHLTGTQTYTVPTPLMRQGDFSEDPNTAQYGLWDPFTTVGPDAQGLFDRTAFGTPAAGVPNGCASSAINANPGVQTCNFATQIPTDRLDPIAMFYMKSFPQPNYLDPLSGCPLASGGVYPTCSNYLGTNGSSQDTNNLSIKIDHQSSDKSKFFAEWLYSPTTYANYRAPWTGPTFPWANPGWGSNYDLGMGNEIIAFGNTYALSPTFVNDFRLSFSRQSMSTHPQHPYSESITDQSQVVQTLAPTKIPEYPYFPMPSFSRSPDRLGVYVCELEAYRDVPFQTVNSPRPANFHTNRTRTYLDHFNEPPTGDAEYDLVGPLIIEPKQTRIFADRLTPTLIVAETRWAEEPVTASTPPAGTARIRNGFLQLEVATDAHLRETQLVNRVTQEVVATPKSVAFVLQTSQGEFTPSQLQVTRTDTSGSDAEAARLNTFLTSQKLDVVAHYELRRADHFLHKWLDIINKSGSELVVRDVTPSSLGLPRSVDLMAGQELTYPVTRPEKGGFFSCLETVYWDHRGDELTYYPGTTLSPGMKMETKKSVIGVYRNTGDLVMGWDRGVRESVTEYHVHISPPPRTGLTSIAKDGQHKLA